MKLPQKERRGKSDDHLIPLINVVFLMLIFFMVIGQIAPPDRFQIRPPTSRSELSAKERSITIAVTRDGSLALNETPVALEALIPRLKLALDAGRQQGDAAEIQIRADAALTAGRLTQILDRLRESGISKVRLLTWSER
ncbi:MAG: biopolymer transporter ExbD [Gammaproteobacteria bacterium]|nr:biopolymer transporter ExbD [Gammaproteobacteria bacterium]MCP5407339.1 biopolymer transporter ExbD [Chromatiaceae bacterium]MCP5409030.1 biopolymer transporter ExbD [Chromatiaceae bacterium]MCP5441921.1 biopolymer transporter ExbD [Chromatiaceae bacterium]